MSGRTAVIDRKTTETNIKVELKIDGNGEYEINTGIGFFDHMLELFARHGGFDLKVKAEGDLYIDGHHTIEDVGICLGDAFVQALGDKRGIARYGFFILPMDETLVEVVLDLSGRTHLHYDAEITAERVGEFETEMAEEFFRAFSDRCAMNLHINKRYGRNAHHIVEGIFKCFARAMKAAVKIESDKIMSTKGVL